MSIDLKGYTALITGASSGMGYEMAKELLSHEATVIIGARDGSKLDKAYKQLSSEGFDVYTVPLDVSDEESVVKAAAWFEKHFDHLDMLVNNMQILQPAVMNKVILFLASSESEGVTGEKIIGMDFDEWLKSKNIIFEKCIN